MILTLEDYTPIPRFDSVPWRGVRINESPNPSGPWTQIEEITFDDADANPAEPKTRSFTTDNRTLDQGWYQVVWFDQSGNLLETDPVLYPPLPDLEYVPSVSDIGDLIRARTKDDSGNEIGTFTAKTRPTAENVQRLISKATGFVSTAIGDDIPDALVDEAQTVVSWLTAMLVELSYYPEQVSTDRSAYGRYKELFDEAIGTADAPGSLVLAVQNAKLDNTVDVTGRALPVGKFPAKVPLRW